MIIFALFTVGYLFGVFTALYIFSPKTREIEEQEIDNLAPIIALESRKLLQKSIKQEGIVPVGIKTLFKAPSKSGYLTN